MAWNDPRYCIECNTEFNRWDRWDKKFCDVSCRKKYHRRKKRFKSLTNKIVDSIEAMDTNAIDDDLKVHRDEYLKVIKNLCEKLLAETDE